MEFDAFQFAQVAIGALLGFLAKNIWSYVGKRSEDNQDEIKSVREESKSEIKALREQMHQLELAMERTNTTLNIFLEEIKGLFRLKDDYKALASKLRKVESSLSPDG